MGPQDLAFDIEAIMSPELQNMDYIRINFPDLYYGYRSNRWLNLGMVLFVLGAFIMIFRQWK